MRFEKERAIAMIAGTGALTFKMSEITIDAIYEGNDWYTARFGFLLLISGWALWSAYRSLRWAGEETGDEKKFASHEWTAVAVLVVFVFGLGFTALLGASAEMLGWSEFLSSQKLGPTD